MRLAEGLRPRQGGESVDLGWMSGWFLVIPSGTTYRDGFRYNLFKNKAEIGWRFKRFWILCDAWKGVLFCASEFLNAIAETN